jgi:hypothetical protein
VAAVTRFFEDAMLSRFAGRCKGCNKPYAEGEDIFWTKETGAYCWDCHDNPKPGPADYALAQRLHFMSHDAALHQLWSTVRFLSGESGIDGERLTRPASGEQAGLWPVRTSSEGEE